MALNASASAAAPNFTSLYPAGAPRGTTTEITAAGTFDPWPVKVWASDKGVTVEAAKAKGKLSIKVAADAAPGVYWLRPYNAEGAGTLRPFIVGTLPEIAEVEPNDEAAKPQALTAPAVVVNGKLAKGEDVDCFGVELKKGQTLVASLEAHHILRSPMDGILQILSPEGFVLDQNNDFRSLDPQLAFTAPQDGRYVVRVFAFSSIPNTSIRFASAETFVYRLTLTTGPFADFALPLAVSPDTKTVEVRGWNIAPELRKLAVPPGPADDSFRGVFDAKLANPLRVRFEPHPSLDFATAPLPKGPLTPPFSATGRIDTTGGEIEFPIAGKKGRPLTIQVESRAFGLPVNPVVRILDSAKKQLTQAAPLKLHTDTTLTFTPAADGPFIVAVSDQFGKGGPRHAFLLRVLPPAPDYDLTIAADRFAVPTDKPLDIPVTVTRRNGFTGPIEVIAEGLPAGVKATMKPAEKPAAKPKGGKAAAETLTLTLTADKPGLLGAFRIVGRVKDTPNLSRTARAALPDFEDSTADLWVTVSNTPVPPPPKKKKR